MGILIYFFQLLESGMRIDLRGGESRVTEQLFHAFQVGVMVEHGSGKSVAQHMWRALLEAAHPLQLLSHYLVNLVESYARTFFRDEKSVTLPFHRP